MLIAKPDDWNNLPMPEQRALLTVDRFFDAREMERIRAGVVPRAMEDKWFIYWQDDELFFHRSWTGNCIYHARFRPEGDGARLIEAVSSRGPERPPIDDARDAEVLLFVLDSSLLRRSARVPTDDPHDLQQRALLTWSLIGRAMLGQHPD